MIKIKKINEDYWISSNGIVYSRPRRGSLGGIMKHSIDNNYIRISFTTSGKSKSYFLHKLLAEAFIPNPNNYDQVNHLDCNKLNNNLDNLEWVTSQQNCLHARKHNLPAVASNTNQKNIYFDKAENKYSVIFRRFQKNNRIGRFKDLESAIKARDKWILENETTNTNI